jgi:hypothetical protein
MLMDKLLKGKGKPHVLILQSMYDDAYIFKIVQITFIM